MSTEFQMPGVRSLAVDMRLDSVVAGLLFSIVAWHSPSASRGAASSASWIAADQRSDLGPDSPLDKRVSETPPDVLKMFAEAGITETKNHALTPEEQRQLTAAFDALPPLHRKILRERLRSLSFLDAMPNTALASGVGPDNPQRLFHITIRAGIFRETVSEWATKKERTCFDAAGSPLSLSIDAGKLDAIAYVLLHEATHIVDSVLRITPEVPIKEAAAVEVVPTAFTKGIWSTIILPAPRYRDPLMQGTVFNDDGKVLPIAKAEALYTAMRRTPFATLYSSHAWTDDLAEYVAIYHWTQILKQPYRITIRGGETEIFEYEPMKSSLVRERFSQMKIFYE